LARITAFNVHAVDLPFRKAFKHAAAERLTSDSVFVECMTDAGVSGFGECLPRGYVTGETRESAFQMLRISILPRLVGMEFNTMAEVYDFLRRCDGKTPGWVTRETPQTAAWCAVDLALLDAFGRVFGQPAMESERKTLPQTFRYSGALSAGSSWSILKSALKQRLFGLKHVKLKVSTPDDVASVRLLHRVFGRGLDVRVDANMGWSRADALRAMPAMAAHGVTSFEQPVPADDIETLSVLVAQTGLSVMADESFSDRESLARLLDARACTAINLRVSKCGGLVASLLRAREALSAGLTVQIGCQVGESSLLSAAHLILCACVGEVRYAEGCFGLHLLKEDPARPLLQFGRGGRPPTLPAQPGLAVELDRQILSMHTSDHRRIDA
jgi:muconate cycloisomerase